MKKLLKKNNGYTLLEVVVSMLVLAIIAAPIGSAFVVSARVNAYADKVFQARLAVSSAAEQLMAEGVVVNGTVSTPQNVTEENGFGDGMVNVTLTTAAPAVDNLYEVTITSTDVETVKVTMQVHGK